LNNDLKSERDWDYSELGGQAGKKKTGRMGDPVLADCQT
jgi:hypothetical protein